MANNSQTPPGDGSDNARPSADDAQIRLRNAVGQWAVELIKAILQTSFYQVQHPNTLKIVDAFFARFAAIQEHFFEITLFALEDERQREVQVEGIFPEPVHLTHCIKGTLSEDFVGKLWDFFQWNKLVTFSVKRDLTREQFLKFLDVTSRGFVRGDGATNQLSTESRLTELLRQQGVFTISAVCRDEVIFVDRPVTWRIRLALSRLRRNIRDIPLYSHANEKIVGEIKARLLKETIYPLKSINLLLELLINCDLVPMENTEFSGVKLEDALAAMLSAAQLQGITAAMIREIGQLPTTKETLARHVRLRTCLNSCIAPLANLGDAAAMNIFHDVVRLGIIAVENLPPRIRELLQVEKQVDTFLASAQEKVAHIQNIRTVHEFEKHAANAAILVADLIQRRQYRWARRIAQALVNGLKSPLTLPDTKRLMSEQLQAISQSKGFQAMMLHLPALAQPQHSDVHFFSRLFPKETIPSLIEELSHCPSDGVRWGIRQVLEEMGPLIVPFVREALQQEKIQPKFCCDLLDLLGRLKERDDFRVVSSFVNSADPEVRNAALVAAAQIGQVAAEPALVTALEDSNPHVKLTALRLLGESASSHKLFVQFLSKLISGALEPAPSKLAFALFKGEVDHLNVDYLTLYTMGCNGLGKLIKKRRVETAPLEPYLLRALRKHLGAAIEGEKDLLEARSKLMIAVIQILAQIGTAEALTVLEKAHRHDFKDVRINAANAMREVSRRLGSSAGPQ